MIMSHSSNAPAETTACGRLPAQDPGNYQNIKNILYSTANNKFRDETPNSNNLQTNNIQFTPKRPSQGTTINPSCSAVRGTTRAGVKRTLAILINTNITNK